MKSLAIVPPLATIIAFTREAGAQATPPSMTPAPAPAAAAGDSSGVLVALALMGALLVVVGVGVKIWDARRKREAEAVHLQSQISDALLREQDFFGLAITPTVHAGMRKNAPARIEVTGQAPSPALRDAALRVVRDEAARMGRDIEIDNHIEITPAAERRRIA